MPRTRQVKNLKESMDESMDFFQQYKSVYLQEKKKLMKQKEDLLQNFRLLSKQHRLLIPASIGNKTLNELRQKSNWQTFSASHMSTLCSTGPSMHSKGELSKKKTSDDGYLTSDSRTDTSGGTRSSRASRRTRSASQSSLRQSARIRSESRGTAHGKSAIKKPTRKSRSVSRTSNLQANKFKTPLNTKTLSNLGMVTPKIKPNTPSVVLRRPQMGEVAISLQGSPLMTTAMVSETTANVNIPLGDGRMINIQPMKGLRRSEIPDLDPEIQRQLKTLRDNLDKVCQFSLAK